MTEHDCLYGYPGRDRERSGTLGIVNYSLHQFFDQRGVHPWGIVLSALRRQTVGQEELALVRDGETIPVSWSQLLTRNRIICLGDPSIRVVTRPWGESQRLVTVTETQTGRTSYRPQYRRPHGQWDAIRHVHDHTAILAGSEEEALAVLERFGGEDWATWCLTRYPLAATQPSGR